MTSKPVVGREILSLPSFNNLEVYKKVNKCRFRVFCLLLDAPKLHLLLVPMSLPLNHLPYIKPHIYLWEISISSLKIDFVRPTKIMNRADKNWAHFQKTEYFKNQSFRKISLIKVDLLVKYSSQKKNQKDLVDFCCQKMTLKVQILQTLRRLFIILIGLTMTGFSEKMLIFNICRRGLMPNLIKKS